MKVGCPPDAMSSLTLACQKENYDSAFHQLVYNSPETTITDLVSGKTPDSPVVRLTYRNKDQFKKSAKMLGLMDDFKVSAASVL